MRNRIKILIRIGVILVIIATLYMIWMIADVTMKQYQETRKWQSTAYTGELKEVAPFLAKNYVNAQDAKAVEIWQQVEPILKEIDEFGGVPDGNADRYEAVLAQSIEQQTLYELTSGEIPERNERLRLYLDLEKLLPTVYNIPVVEPLQEITNRLYTMHMNVQAPVHEQYFKKLQTISVDYQNLSIFLTESLPQLGQITDKTLNVDKQVGEKTTKVLLAELDEKGLRKFPFLDDLYELLISNEWNNVLKRNQITRAYDTWKAAESELESIGKSSYYEVSSITTYQKALEMGLDVKVRERTGYTVDPESPVYSITYNGNTVSKEQFIQYGTPVIVTLNEKYMKIPEKIDEDSDDEDSDETKSDTSGNNTNPTRPSNSNNSTNNGTGNQRPDDWDEDWDEDESEETERQTSSNQNWNRDW